MSARDDVNGLIVTIYAAVEEPAAWGHALEALRRALDARGAALMHHDPHAPLLGVDAYAGFDPEAIARYRAYYSTVDPWGRALRPDHWTPGRIFNGLELVSASDVKRSEYYNDFGRQFGCVNATFGILEPLGPRVGFITANRGDTQPEFSDDDLRLLKVLTPHLRNAFRLQRRVASAQGVAAVSSHALDALLVGVALLDAAGSVLFMNRAAVAITARRDGLWEERRRLRGWTPADTRRLDRAVQIASLAEAPAARSADLAFTLTRPSADTPLRVVVVPLGAPSQQLGQDVGASIALFVDDPRRRAVSAPDRLVQLFGFTPAEARVASLLAEGLTVARIADGLSVAPSTVRGHVKALLHKTGVRTQGQLIALVLRGPGAILGPR